MIAKPNQPVLVLLTGHWLSLIGSGLVTTAAISWLFVLPLSVRGHVSNPYIGIIAFVALPVVFFAGLALIPVGVWLSKRRIRKGLAEAAVDRKTTLHRLAVFLLITTCANILIASQLTYRAVDYMDTNQFCGQSCHVMHPQFTAYQTSAHSRVGCADCHIAPGAAGWFHAKLNGTRQLFEVTFNTYPRPIPLPLATGRLISPDESCERCHAIRNSGTYRMRVIKHYSDDQTPKPLTTVLMMRIGGGTSWGIHGMHLGRGITIRYATKDPTREDIPWIEYRDAASNKVRTFTSGINAEEAANLPTFEMQCVDCHSQPAHTFQQPDSAVDAALDAGSIPRDLPFVRKEGVALVKASYTSQEDAAAKIPQALAVFYRGSDPAAEQRPADINRAAQALVAIYRRNVFPDMKITWGTYPNQLGHTESTGCFRCHDGAHTAKDGDSITQDCNACHQVVASDEPSPDVLKTLGMEAATQTQKQ